MPREYKKLNDENREPEEIELKGLNLKPTDEKEKNDSWPPDLKNPLIPEKETLEKDEFPVQTEALRLIADVKEFLDEEKDLSEEERDKYAEMISKIDPRSIAAQLYRSAAMNWDKIKDSRIETLKASIRTKYSQLLKKLEKEKKILMENQYLREKENLRRRKGAELEALLLLKPQCKKAFTDNRDGYINLINELKHQFINAKEWKRAIQLSKQNENTKQMCSEKLSKAYAKISEQGDQARLPGWERSYDKRYDITTWTYTAKVDPHPDQAIPVGSNGQLIIKIFGDNSYDYVKTEDFLDRGKLLFDAAKKIFRDDKSLTKEIRDWALQKLDENKAAFESDINENCDLDPVIMRERDKAYKKDYFKGKYDQAKEIIQKHLLATADLISTCRNFGFSESVERLKKAEKEWIAERGRPNILKIGKINGQAMFSAQLTQGEVTLPSTLRKGSGAVKLSEGELDLSTVKLSNHALDITGHLENGSDLHVDCMLDTHSTYSPYLEANPMVQQKIAYEAVKEKIAASARLIMQSSPDLGTQKDRPIPVSLSTLMLFTPLKLLYGKKFQAGAVEIDQMAVSRRALEMARHQEQPLALQVDGKTIYVDLDLSYMSIPANLFGLGRVGSLSTNDQLEKTINARGFYEYCKNMDRFLNTSDQGMDQFLDQDQKKTLEDLSGQMREQYQKMEAALYERVSPPEEDLRQDLNVLVRLVLGAGRALKNAWRALKNLILPQDPFKSQFNNCKQEIKALEKKEFALYQAAIDKTKAAFNAHKTAATNRVDPNDPHATLAERYLRAQELFYSGKYKQIEYAFQFHVLYLLTNEQIGRTIESFCKSGEDRSGWLRVSMLAFLAFKNAKQRDPDLSNRKDKDDYDRIYAFAAHELSASLDNTKYNSEARGLQVNKAVTNPHIGVSMGDQMAKLAKGVFPNRINRMTKLAKEIFSKLPPKPGRKPQPPVSSSDPHFFHPMPDEDLSSQGSKLSSNPALMDASVPLLDPRTETAIPSRTEEHQSLYSPPQPHYPGFTLAASPAKDETIDFVKTLSQSQSKKWLNEFCDQHQFESPQTDLLENKIVLTHKQDRAFSVEVNSNSVKANKLPLSDQTDNYIKSIIQLYLQAIKGIEGNTHRIKCKDPALIGKVEYRLACELRDQGRFDLQSTTINDKALEDIFREKEEEDPGEFKYGR